VKFSYTATYPDEPPLIEITETDNVDEDQQNELMTLMQTTVWMLLYILIKNNTSKDIQ